MKKYKPKEMVIGVTAAALYMNRSRMNTYKLIEAGKLNPVQPYRGSQFFSIKELDRYKK